MKTIKIRVKPYGKRINVTVFKGFWDEIVQREIVDTEEEAKEIIADAVKRAFNSNYEMY